MGNRGEFTFDKDGIMSLDELQAKMKLMDEFDILSVYTDGKPDITKIKEHGAGWLIKSVTTDQNGKVIDLSLFNDYVGYVYIIGAVNGFIKIGRTKDVEQRLSALKTMSPIFIELVHSKFVRNSLELENGLHYLFKDKRSHGEWFDLTKKDIEEAIIIIESAK